MKKTILSLFAVIIIISIFLLYYAHNKRTSIYNYDPTLGYTYDFEDTDVEIYPIKIENNIFQSPLTESNNITAFLKVNLKSTLFGEFFKPQINIHFNDKTISQQFELGVEQTRFLNISEAINANIDQIEIDVKYASLVDDKVSLYVFKNNNLKDKRILIISPHPDDAEIAAYGLYASYPENTFIVTVTAGDAGEFKYDEIYKDSLIHYHQKGKIRTWNSLTVPLLGGIKPENILNLGYFNEALVNMHQNDTALVKTKFTKTYDVNTFRKQNSSTLIDSIKATSTWNSLVEDFTFLLDTIQPDIIVTPHPELDSHLDHQYSTIAMIEAIKKTGLNKGYLFLYTNHLPQSEAYPFGEMYQPITLPPYFDNSLYFESIYSFPVPLSVQKEKIFTLDAMNDLRLDTEYLNTQSTFIYALKTLKRNTVGPENNYFRRSVRSNELFFVVPINQISKLK